MKKQIMLLAVLSFISCGQEGTGSSNSSIKLNSSSESDVTRNPHIDILNLKSFSKKNKRPSRLDSRYYSIVEHMGDKGLELVVSGVEINLEVGSHQGLYEQLHNRSDISQLIIQAEKITLSSPLQVGGSDIIINAKSLIFNESGKLITTPVSMHAPIAQQYQDGIDGEDGGSIELNVENIITFDDQVILVTDGGNGQDAGPGSNGARGTNAHLYSGYYVYHRERCRERLVGPRGGRKGSYLCSTLKNFNGRPSGNGQNARVGGRPGEAGSAGEIKYLKKMNLKTSMQGGIAGKEDSIRIGGAPGLPLQTCKKSIGEGENSHDRTFGCISAVKGSDRAPIKANKLRGDDNQISLIKNKSTWLKDEILALKLKYAKDLYRARYTEESLNLFKSLEQYLSNKTNPTLKSEQVKSQTSKHLNLLNSHLDYFGHSSSWTPTLGFEVNYKLYKNEIDRNLRLFFIAEKLSYKLEKDSISFDELKILQNELLIKIEDNKKQASTNILNIVYANEAIDELKVAENEFQFHLEVLDKEIRKKASQNIRIPFMSKAIQIFAAASKVIPVGQPALGAIGSGLDFFNKATSGKMTTGEILETLPTVYGQLDGLDWKQTKVEIESKFNELSYSEFEKLKTLKEKAAHLQKISAFTSPVLEAISGQVADWKNHEISETELDREINKLRDAHPIYRKVIKALNTLNFKRKVFKSKVARIQANIEDALASITTNYSALAFSFDKISELQATKKNELSLSIDDVKEDALESLIYYSYMFEKSFEYRTLEDYSNSMDIDKLSEKVMSIIKDDNLSYLNSIENLQLFYEKSLSKITRSIVDNFNVKGPSAILSKEYNFSTVELMALSSGEEIYIDMTKENFFGKDKENIRLNGLKVVTIETTGEKSEVEMTLAHSGISLFEKDGSHYSFNHESSKANLNFRWISLFNPNSGELYHSEINQDDESLLANILDLNEVTTSYFVNPGARTFIKVKARKNSKTKITALRVLIDYSFYLKE